ncbi:MAG: DUF2723 domain-containing protein [Chloroflexota bacterium]
MIRFGTDSNSRIWDSLREIDDESINWPIGLLSLFFAMGSFFFYTFFLARGLILGDPTEYTFVAHLVAIAHPPGYVFMTLMGKLFQTIIPFGSIAWRTHLMAAFVGSLAATTVFGVTWLSLRWLKAWVNLSQDGFIKHVPIGVSISLWAALNVLLAANHWQHSIHANPHIITGTFLIGNLFLLLWWAKRSGLPNDLPFSEANSRSRSRLTPLLLFSLSTGIGVAHHPLTVFSFPAYTLFILLVNPRILTDWRTLLKMVGMAALGLSLFIYYPIVSAGDPAVGPHSMNTLDGFLDHVLARGLSESLPYYSLAELPLRLIVLWSISRLQYTLPVMLFAVYGLLFLIRGLFIRSLRPLAALLLAAFLGNVAFVISLKQQDIMAYLLGPLMLLAVSGGIAVYRLLLTARDLNLQRFSPLPARLSIFASMLLILTLIGPLPSLLANLPQISLHDFDEGNQHVDAVFAYFEGEGEGVVLLNDWEFMTPLWYAEYVEARVPDPDDIRPEFVSAAEPWLPSVFNYLGGGPVYINSYRREIVDAGFRLRPRGPFYQVVEPKEQSLPPELSPVERSGLEIELVGFELPAEPVEGGEFVPLTLAMSLPAKTDEFYAPVVTVGEIELPFTTDTHLITPLWEPNEIIIERFDFALPHSLPAGEYPVTVRIQNLSKNVDSGVLAEIGSLTVVEPRRQPRSDHYLANFRQRVGLRSAILVGNGEIRRDQWDEALITAPGDVLWFVPEWEVIDQAEESYTIFVHLIDVNNQLYIDDLDYTPLGGATPTHLWFPKWLPGQRMRDPYRVVIPEGLAPGPYFLEVGIYEMRSGRRLHMHDTDGNLIGDRFILGEILVE